MKLSINIPTRGRPLNLKPTLEYTLKTSICDDTRIMVAIDDDDQITLDALDTLPKHEKLIYSVKPREDTRGGKTNRLLTEAPADVYIVGHDSSPMITTGWDRMFINGARLFTDGVGVVGSATSNGGAFPAIQAVTAKWVDIVGYFYNPAYPFWFIDHELDDLSRMTGRICYVAAEASIVAMRPSKTIRLRDLIFWIDYFDLSRFRRRAMAAKIIDALDCSDHEKMIRRSWYSPVEDRSLAMHRSLRARADKVEQERGEDGPPDSGYLRAFEQARQDLRVIRNEISMMHKGSA